MSLKTVPIKKIIIIMLIIFILIFLRGYVFGYKITIFFNDNIDISQAKKLLTQYEGTNICGTINRGSKKIFIKEVVCYKEIRTNLIQIESIIKQLNNEEIVRVAGYSSDFIDNIGEL